MKNWRLVGIAVIAMYVYTVDTVLVNTLQLVSHAALTVYLRRRNRTCGGPRIVPFQLDIIRSSASASPYEQASAIVQSSICRSLFQ